MVPQAGIRRVVRERDKNQDRRISQLLGDKISEREENDRGSREEGANAAGI